MRSDRLVPCRDAVGQARSVIVVADRCGVVMIGPPGEVAVLSEDDVTALCAALCAASAECGWWTGCECRCPTSKIGGSVGPRPTSSGHIGFCGRGGTSPTATPDGPPNKSPNRGLSGVSMMTSRRARRDRPVLVGIGCTIRVTDQDAVTVHRDPGCTLDNIRELCDALVSGELEIIDLTEPTNGATMQQEP